MKMWRRRCGEEQWRWSHAGAHMEEGWMKDLVQICHGVLHSTQSLHSPLFAWPYLCKNSNIDLFFPCHVVCYVTASVAVLRVGLTTFPGVVLEAVRERELLFCVYFCWPHGKSGFMVMWQQKWCVVCEWLKLVTPSRYLPHSEIEQEVRWEAIIEVMIMLYKFVVCIFCLLFYFHWCWGGFCASSAFLSPSGSILWQDFWSLAFTSGCRSHAQ